MRYQPLLQRGFTMIELLMVLAIGAVLAMIAVPSMRDMLNTSRLNSATALVVNDLNQARGEAIKRNTRMLVCRRDAAGTDCEASAGPPFDWRAGWLVCIEGLVVGQCAASSAADPNPIIVRPPLDASLTLASPVVFVRFSPNSAVAAAADFDLGGVWTGAVPRKVCILRTGNMLKLPPPPGSQVCPS